MKNCTNFVMCFSFFFFFSCFVLSENVGMMRLSLPTWWVIMYKLVLNCIVIELCKMVDVVSLKPLNNISLFKIKCYLC